MAAAAAAAASVPRTGAAMLLFSAASTARCTAQKRMPSSFHFPFPSSSYRYASPCYVLPILDPARRLRRAYCSTTPLPAKSTEEGIDAAADVAHDVAPRDPLRELADALDIRVGRVLKAWRHPEADSLFVEEVDVGEAEPRTICSGLVNYIPLEQLQDSRVVVLANLKPRNMRGIKSNGMLMAASDESHENVELLIPPEGSMPGERIWFGTEEERDKQADPATPNQVLKKKIWEHVQPHLKTTDGCVTVLDESPMRTSAGVVVCKSLKKAKIS